VQFLFAESLTLGRIVWMKNVQAWWSIQRRLVSRMVRRSTVRLLEDIPVNRATTG